MSEKSDIQRIMRVRKRIAYRLRQLRSDQGLTQEVVAGRSGLALRHLQKIEAAQVNLTIESLTRVAEALGVDPEDLLSDDDQKPIR